MVFSKGGRQVGRWIGMQFGSFRTFCHTLMLTYLNRRNGFLIWLGIRGGYLYFCGCRAGRRKGVCIWHGMRGRREEAPGAPILRPTLATTTNNTGHQCNLLSKGIKTQYSSCQPISRDVQLCSSWTFIGHLHFALDPLFCIPVLQTWPLWAGRGLRAILAKHHLANSGSFAL